MLAASVMAALLANTFAASSSSVGVGDAETSDAASAKRAEENFMMTMSHRSDQVERVRRR